MAASVTTSRSGYPLRVSRRGFVFTTGALAAAAELGLCNFVSSLVAADAEPPKRPLVRVAFARPKVDRDKLNYYWPGAAYDVEARQADYTRVLRSAADKLSVDLEILDAPLHDSAGVSTFLDDLKKARPDGLLIVLMAMWENTVCEVAQNRGDIPLIVFAPQGTMYLAEIQSFPKIPKTLLLATPDIEALGLGVRLLSADWHMRNTRLLMVAGDVNEDYLVEPVGTTLHYIPLSHFVAERQNIEETEEVRALADYYQKAAQQVVEPRREEILEAAKWYFVARRMLKAENCHGLNVACFEMLQQGVAPPQCMPLAQLRDEGVATACGDWPCAVSQRMVELLLSGQQGFQQNISANTVDNTLTGAHCSCHTRLDGLDKPPAPFILRSHSEGNTGVAMQVLFRPGQELTIMKVSTPNWKWLHKPERTASGAAVIPSILLGTGRVVRNLDTPPSGGCRTAVEVKVDGVEDVRNLVALHHQLWIYGNHVREFKLYAELAGIKVEPLYRT